jgi:hypothetical protein
MILKADPRRLCDLGFPYGTLRVTAYQEVYTCYPCKHHFCSVTANEPAAALFIRFSPMTGQRVGGHQVKTAVAENPLHAMALIYEMIKQVTPGGNE